MENVFLYRNFFMQVYIIMIIKGNESIIIFVVLGFDYECLYVDVGINGRNLDGYVWSRSFFKYVLDNLDNLLNILFSRLFFGRRNLVFFVFIGDEVFRLFKYMLKFYFSRNFIVDQRIINYRILRGRRIFENILGILGNRWRCFRVFFLLVLFKVKGIILVVFIFYNWLRVDVSSRNIYSLFVFIDREDFEIVEVIFGLWREDILIGFFFNLQFLTLRNCFNEVKNMREEFIQWFNNEGDVLW